LPQQDFNRLATTLNQIPAGRNNYLFQPMNDAIPADERQNDWAALAPDGSAAPHQRQAICYFAALVQN
jgi:hypothetical protein